MTCDDMGIELCVHENLGHPVEKHSIVFHRAGSTTHDITEAIQDIDVLFLVDVMMICMGIGTTHEFHMSNPVIFVRMY